MVRTAKGLELNMEQLALQHGDAIALGNASMNSRGDMLGKGGKIIKTREDLARDYHTKGTNAVKTVPMSTEINKMFEKPKEAKAPVLKTEVKEEVALEELVEDITIENVHEEVDFEVTKKKNKKKK